MTEISVDQTPAPWREVYLTIALMVARDGLPAPIYQNQYEDGGFGGPWVDFRLATHADAAAWADLLGASKLDSRQTRDQRRVLHRHTRGQLLGWSIDPYAYEPWPSAETHPDLAAQVVTAILTPDAADPVPACDHEWDWDPSPSEAICCVRCGDVAKYRNEALAQMRERAR